MSRPKRKVPLAVISSYLDLFQHETGIDMGSPNRDTYTGLLVACQVIYWLIERLVKQGDKPI